MPYFILYNISKAHKNLKRLIGGLPFTVENLSEEIFNNTSIIISLKICFANILCCLRYTWNKNGNNAPFEDLIETYVIFPELNDIPNIQKKNKTLAALVIG